GTIRWMEGRGQVFRNEAGEAVHLIGILRDVTGRKRTERRMAAQHAVTRVLAEAATLAEAAPGILQAICQSAGWDLGALWSLDPRPPAPRVPGTLSCLDVWSARRPHEATEFEATTRETTFPLGVGLPGRVWESGEPLWITDV